MLLSVGADSQSLKQHRATSPKAAPGVPESCSSLHVLLMGFAWWRTSWRLRIPPDELTTELEGEINTSQQLQATTHRTLAILASCKKNMRTKLI